MFIIILVQVSITRRRERFSRNLDHIFIDQMRSEEAAFEKSCAFSRMSGTVNISALNRMKQSCETDAV